MRFGLLVLSIIIVGAGAQLFFPWWSLVVVACLLGALLPLRTGSLNFGAGFLAGFLLWGLYAWYLSTLNEGILAARIGTLLGGLPGGLMPWVSGLFAAIVTALGALTGRLGRDFYQPANE